MIRNMINDKFISIDFNQNFMEYASSRPGVDQLIGDLDRISLPLFWRLTCGLALMILHARASSVQNAFNCNIYNSTSKYFTAFQNC